MKSRFRDIAYLLVVGLLRPAVTVISTALWRCSRTAPSTIKPLVTCCVSVDRFICVIRLKISANVRTPRNVPLIVARPPARLVPPMTTAPMASVS